MYDFIKNIQESRAYKRLSLFDGVSVDVVALKALNMFLALKVLYYMDKAEAKTYARKMVDRQDYTGFHTSQPDLYNLLVLVFKQDRYNIKGSTVVFPEMRIKRVMRDMANGNLNERDYNELLLKVMRATKKTEGTHWRLRRRIARFEKADDNEKSQIIKLLMVQLRINESVYPDLYVLLQSASHKQGINV